MRSFPEFVRPTYASPRSRQAVMLLRERGPSSRSILVGVAGSILFHLLFLFGVPPSYFAFQPRPPEAADYDLEIDLAPDEVTLAQPYYVETNPEAPENIPDKTDAFGARNQQAANEKVPEELSPDNSPAREGEKDLPFDKLLNGELNPDLQVTSSPLTPEPSEQTSASTPALKKPLPGFEQDEGESEDGAGSSVADVSPETTPAPERSEGQPTESQDTLLQTLSEALNQPLPTPAPRPRLPRTTPGPVKEHTAGVSRTGHIAVDANFSEFGEYMERMIEAVSQRWHALCASRAYSESTAHVMLEFKLTRAGMIKDLETLDSTSQALGVLLCRSAVEGGQSYGAWTKDMVDVLGEEQTVKFNFYYW